MSALVPYASSELASPAAQLGLAVGQQLGSAALAAGKRMYATRASSGRTKKRKAQSRNVFDDLGRKPGSNESRRTVRESGVTSVSNKELFDEPLIRVEKNVAGDEALNKRNRDTINYKGTKICFIAKNILKVPVFLNWAIVVPKALDSISATDFLRDGSTERDQPVANTASFLDLRCAPINSDRYRVLMHQRHTILPDSDKGGTFQSEGRDIKIIEKYIPLKRQIFFDGDAATPLQNAYMVWWCDFYNSTTGGVKSDTLDVSWRMIQYYQDIP